MMNHILCGMQIFTGLWKATIYHATEVVGPHVSFMFDMDVDMPTAQQRVDYGNSLRQLTMDNFDIFNFRIPEVGKLMKGVMEKYHDKKPDEDATMEER